MTYRVKELGFDMFTSIGRDPFDHMAESDRSWSFFTGKEPEVSKGILEIPKHVTDDEEVAIKIAKFTLNHIRWAYEAGEKEGQAQAQRFFRLAFGVETPTSREAVMWNNPVPLLKDRVEHE